MKKPSDCWRRCGIWRASSRPGGSIRSRRSMRCWTNGRCFTTRPRSGGSFITKGFWTGRQTAAATGRKKARLRWKRFWRSISERCGPVSKYDALWAYLQKSGRPRLVLTFAQIGQIAGVPLDHAFLRCKKELCAYGYAVEKISLKAKTVAFVRREEESV